MEYGQSNEIKALQTSLINFLLQKRDLEEKVQSGKRRISALSFNIIFPENEEPLFTVRIGVCEAAFDAVTAIKVRGNCYGLERYIRDWFERSIVSTDIKNYIEANAPKE